MNRRRHQRIKTGTRLWIIAPFLLLLSQVFAQTSHRVFPAAKSESYNHQNLPPILGVLSSIDEISFVTSYSSRLSVTTQNARVTRANTNTTTENKETSDDRILDQALKRFRNSLRRYPDFQDDYPVNPTGLPLIPIDTSFDVSIKLPNSGLYHGVPEDYAIHISAASTEGTNNRLDGDNTNPFIRKELHDNATIKVSVEASTVFGVLRALETLGQLMEFGWMNKSGGGEDLSASFVVRDLPLSIADEPAFPHRGLMIDTARHYLPMKLILDNLNAMAMNKMNVLHWHMSDSQSFPYAPKGLPELAQKGAYHPKRIYTPQDVKRVVEEAYLRGIRVIPEIDMPGHTNAIAASHPEIMSHCPDPSEPMNPTVPETYKFISRIYQDLDEDFSDDMVHLGCDEVNLSDACWLKDPTIAKWMEEHGMGDKVVELYDYFETNLLKTIEGLDKTPIVWQEAFNLNLTIPKNTIIDVWKGFDSNTIRNAVDQGHRVILSGCWYLDHLDKTWQHFYECDPLNFTSSNKELMIGGHASMWGEHCDASNFVSRVWPRASSAAERLWHGTTDKSAKDSIHERIHKFRCRMVQMGFPAGPTGPGVCPTEVAYSSSTTLVGGGGEETAARNRREMVA